MCVEEESELALATKFAAWRKLRTSPAELVAGTLSNHCYGIQKQHTTAKTLQLNARKNFIRRDPYDFQTWANMTAKSNLSQNTESPAIVVHPKPQYDQLETCLDGKVLATSRKRKLL